jgi:hypothetical protein
LGDRFGWRYHCYRDSQYCSGCGAGIDQGSWGEILKLRIIQDINLGSMHEKNAKDP